MANNLYVNKVDYGGRTLIDLTGDTVTPETLALGVTAHAADGSVIVGTMSILDAYPIGSIYMSVVNTNPGTIFGGTWTSFGAGRVLVGVDPNDTDFEDAQLTGGEKTHTLTQGELPKTTGSMTMRQWTKTAGGSATFSHSGIISKSYVKVANVPLGADSGTQKQADLLTISFGNDEAHNNLQPYITCYMWKRTA